MNLVKDLYEKLGYFDNNGDSKNTIFLREELNNLVCGMNDSNCISAEVDAFIK